MCCLCLCTYAYLCIHSRDIGTYVEYITYMYVCTYKYVRILLCCFNTSAEVSHITTNPISFGQADSQQAFTTQTSTSISLHQWDRYQKVSQCTSQFFFVWFVAIFATTASHTSAETYQFPAKATKAIRSSKEVIAQS